MTVLAGVIAVEVVVAIITEVERAAKQWSAAGFNVSHGAKVRGEHSRAKLSAVLFAMLSEYVGKLDHHISPRMELMASAPTLSAVAVK
jgi:hypothetical protein